MATPSCSDVALVALLVVSSVSVVHTAARPIIPNVRPLNCAFCLSLWVALGAAAGLWTLEALLAIPVAGFLAVIASGQWPWAFYAVPVAEADQPGKV
jgi:hypothetical protein